MKTIFKKLVFPICLATGAASLSIGATFALFTSDSKTELNISSGKIVSDVDVSIEKLYSAKYDVSGTLHDENDYPYSYEEMTNHFYNGGTATVTESGLSILNITPGDKIEASLHLTNNSTINTKYRLIVSVSEDDYVLASGLDLTIDGVNANGIAYYASDWVSVDANSSYERDIPVVIELPIYRGNVYQNRTCSYDIKMETVQANAYVESGAVMNAIELSSTALPSNSVVTVGNVFTLSLEGNTTLDISSTTPDPINSGEMVSVSIPSGVKIDSGTKDLVLVVSKAEGANFTVNSDEEVNVAYNIDVSGIASDNTGLISVTVPYNNVADPTRITHIKDDGSREDILPYSTQNPNGFVYSGGYITFKTASFSQFNIVTHEKCLYFINRFNWDHVHAYMWDGGNDNGWPGVEITSNVHSTTSAYGDSDILYVNCKDYKNVIFNNGGDSAKTVDITSFAQGNLYWPTSTDNEGKFYCDKLTYDQAFNSVFFSRPNVSEWTNHTTYAYMWSGGNQNHEWPGVEMTWVLNNAQGEGIFRMSVGNYDNVIFTNNFYQKTVTISDLQSKKGKGFYRDTYNSMDENTYVYNAGEYTFVDYYTQSLVDAVNEAQNGDTLKLTNDINIPNPFAISKQVTIDLNGHNISYTGNQFNIFTVEDGGSLTIKDTSNVVQYGKWNGNTYEISSSNSDGARRFKGGIIHGGKGEDELLPFTYNTAAGGAIIVEAGGTLNLQSGNIAGNSVDGNTGGVSNNGGTVNMSGGQISDNKASNGSGGAIYNNKGTFNMMGGVIANNEATRGAVIVRGATFNFSGGSIEDNTARQFMIDVTPGPDDTYGTVNMSGTANVSGNTCTHNVGSAYFVRGGCTFNMTGGTIEDNTAAHYISVNNFYDLVYSGGAITADESYSGYLTISGGTISGNIGGGVNVYGTGNRLRLSGSAYIYDNWFDETNGQRLDVFMDAWRGQCPTLVDALTTGAKIGLYEGHFLNDPDTYGCVLRIGYSFTGNKADILDHLVSDRGATLDYYAAPVISNVGYWNDGNAYIRQTA